MATTTEHRHVDKYALLAAVPLFKDAPDHVVEVFSRASDFSVYRKGEALFLQDDPTDWFYLILSGWVKLFRETMDGNEAVIEIVSSGQLVAETAIFENNEHAYSAVAIEDSGVLRLPVSALQNAIEKDNQLALAMLGSLSLHRKRQTREIESLTLQNASQRIGCFLLRLCRSDDDGPIELQLPYDKTHIAARLGMKSETFSRALNKLRQETGITVKGATVTIPTIDVMSRFACSGCSNEFPCDDMH